MHLTPVMLLVGTLCGNSIGAAGGVLLVRHPRLANAGCFGLAALSGLGGLLTAVWFLTNAVEAPPVELLPPLLPYVHFSIRLDALSAYFLLLVSLLSMAIGIYSLGYAKSYYGRKNVGLLGALFNALVLATTLIVLAHDVWLFLIAWELMALTAFCLVSFEHEAAEARKAGVLYFIMSHIDAGCIIFGLLLLCQASGGTSFASLHGVGATMSPGKRDAAFLLFLVGFGIKAGIVPLHLWLPAAHPVTPSNVSAFMSGVLIKTGIYGLIRVGFDFLGPPPLWWGVTVLTVGTISAVVGVLYALMEHDLKRLLAYHSIENVGIILMGLGAALMFLRTGHPVLAALALVAGLYHTLNHAAFKGLLFLGAGAVVHATHTRNMEAMGGLIKRMPQTAVLFLIGAVAISALPPLNGFVSEWLTYQALLQGFGTTDRLVRLLFPLSGAMLALTGALAAACFVKAFGITFLAQPRSAPAAQAHEAPPTMRVGMALLAAVCVGLGLFPTQFVRVLDPLTRQLVGQTISGQLGEADGLVLSSLTANGGTVSPAGLALIAVCLLPIPFGLWLVFARQATVRRGPTWDCGQRGLTPRMEYTATGFSKPLRMVFKALFRPHREVQREYDFSPYFAHTVRFDSRVEEVFERRFYRPARALILRASRRVRALQAGSVHAYLLYIFLTLLLLLLLFAPMSLNVSAIVAQTALLLLLAPLVSGLIYKGKATLQNRRGAPVWQPYLDLAKFLRKGMVISEHASWVFSATPFVLLLATLTAGLLVPLVTVQAPLGLFGGALALVGLLALGRFFLALAGLDPATTFGGMGSSREMTIAAVAEPAMMLAIFTVAITAGSTSLSEIVRTGQGLGWTILDPPHALALSAMFIVLLAETGRVPVDNPATHLELTMIHEAMMLEYSGRQLAFMEWSAAIKQLVLMALLANLFFPVGLAVETTPAALGMGLLWLGAKLLVLSGVVVLIEFTNSKLRLFRVPDLLSAAFILATLALVSTFLFR